MQHTNGLLKQFVRRKIFRDLQNIDESSAFACSQIRLPKWKEAVTAYIAL